MTLLEACKLQHEAIDDLMARLNEADRSFMPTKSGKPWDAVLAGNAAIAQASAQPEPAAIVREKPHSLEVHRDAKGVYSWTAKVYFDLDDFATEDSAPTSLLEDIDADMRKRFLPPEPDLGDQLEASIATLAARAGTYK